MFRFADPYMLYLLPIIPLLVVLFIFLVKRKKRALERFGNIETLKPLMPEVSELRVRNKFILVLCALTLIIFALARPQLGSKLKERSVRGIELMLLIDVSNSMLAEDLSPNRLERTKFAINRLLSSLTEDKVGLIIFAGEPYVQLPITADYVSARNFVSQISPNMISRQGTDISSAIDLAVSSFSSESEGSRAIILISDGESHESGVESTIERAKALGIKIYTIGIGTPEGSPIKIDGDFIMDDDGNMVVSKLGEALLENIAVSTGGAYIRATNQNLGLMEIIDEINRTEKKSFKQMIFDQFNEQYQYLLGLALVFLLLDGLMISRKNRILSRFNIFNK